MSGGKPVEVRCPQCGGVSLWSPENSARPFCSERCKLIDLGAWASERYRVPIVEDDEDTELSGTPPSEPGTIN